MESTTTKSYADIVNADIRLCVLQVLNEDAGFSHNAGVIKSALAVLGHRISYDSLLTHLGWLDEQGYVEIEHRPAGRSARSLLPVVKLTERGADVALGHVVVFGVARPRPS